MSSIAGCVKRRKKKTRKKRGGSPLPPVSYDELNITPWNLVRNNGDMVYDMKNKKNDKVDKVRITKKFRAIKYQIVKQVLDGRARTYITPYDDVVLTKRRYPFSKIRGSPLPPVPYDKLKITPRNLEINNGDGVYDMKIKNNDEVDVIKVRITKKYRAIKFQRVYQVLDGSLGRWAVVSGRYEGYTPIGDHTGPWTYITPYDDVVLTKHISTAKTGKLAVIGVVGGRRRRTRKKRGGDKWESARKQEKKKYCKKYYKGKYGINKKGCKKDPMCKYVDMGSGGEWCYTKKRKYKKKKRKTRRKKRKTRRKR